MERKRTLTIANWDGLRDDDDDDHFFESLDRKSSATPLDLDASSSDDEDFDDCRMSFSSAVSSARRDELVDFSRASSAATMAAPSSPDYNVWMMAPGSIKERRKRLFQGMGLTSNKSLLKLTSDEFQRDISKKIENEPIENVVSSSQPDDKKREPEISVSPSPSPFPILLVRSRSEGDIDAFSMDKQRKEDLLGRVSKQRLTKTNSMILTPKARMYPESVRMSPRVGGGPSSSVRQGSRGAMTPLMSKNQFGAFLLIKNLDTGKEFIVNEADQEGRWNKLSDVETGKQLTVEEFEKCVGYSPVVKELMRRASVSRMNGESENERKLSAFSKSLRMSKKKVANFKNSIKGLSHSVSGLIGEKEKEIPPTPLEQKQGKNGNSSEWIKVRSSGKSFKELSALHLCQEIQAHEGSIWTIKFSWDAHYLASAGEDKVIHVWEVQECELMSLREEGGSTPLHPSLCNSPIHPSFCPSPDRSGPLGDPTMQSNEKKKKGKGSSNKKGSNIIPDYVHVPETVFALSEKPICSFKGHLDDVLDLSWSMSQLLLSSSMDKTVRLWDIESKSCLKLFAHNDYVTCVHFNPTDEDYFISGSLDAKVRIWDVPKRQVVDWTDLHEMVTAVCYTPDGQGAVIGSHKGSCRTYDAEENKLTQTNQIQLQSKKKAQTKKITGFQFSPTNPSEVLVTSADSRIRVVDGTHVVHKFKGFRNTSSQITASFSQDGRYVICASEDSQVYIWRRDDPRSANLGNRKVITTQSHEQFQCKDVSAAVFWPGTIRGQPPPSALQSKRNSKRLQPVSAGCSPTREDNVVANSKRLLPPLPKKKHTNSTGNLPETNNNSSPPEEERNSQICRSESRVGESFSSEGNSSRFNDPSSISASPTPSSSSWSSSWSWLDIGGSQNQTFQATAWGLVIVTAGLGGEIKAYQNFGIPRKVGRQVFGGPT